MPPALPPAELFEALPPAELSRPAGTQVRRVHGARRAGGREHEGEPGRREGEPERRERRERRGRMRGAASLAERVGADVPHEVGLVQEHLLCGELEELAEGVRAARWAERRKEVGEDKCGSPGLEGGAAGIARRLVQRLAASVRQVAAAAVAERDAAAGPLARPVHSPAVEGGLRDSGAGRPAR